jgi:hypothetical protein
MNAIPMSDAELSDAELLARAKKADVSAGLIVSDKGVIRPCERNAYLLLSGEPRFGSLHYDEFLQRPRFEGRDWSDTDEVGAVQWLQGEFQVPGFKIEHVRHAARLLAHERRRDSLVHFIRTLPEWDGTERIDVALMDAFGAPASPVTRAASRNLFVAMIARGLNPGCQVDTLWAFEGPQGTKKSQAMRALGGAWHAEITAAVGTSDFYRELRDGVWLAELPELDAFRGREATTIKRILSAPVDRFVDKYDKHATAYPRRAVAIATTNESTYWQDTTGARRLVPIPTGDISVDLVKENRLQWFAEALRKFSAGVTWWEFPAEIQQVQEDRQQVDSWEDVLRNFIDHGRRGPEGASTAVTHWPAGWISTAEIMANWLQLDAGRQGTASGHRLGRVMRRLGFRPERRGHTRERGWTPVTTADEDT